MQDLTEQAEHGGDCSAFDYRALVEAILSRGEVREDVQAHPGVMIWGTIEARVQGAELVVLAGLNEGVWPKAPPPDPWLNRQMRKQAGLLLPERRIGLSAHDYQQAVCGPEVVLSRASRDAEAETVSSRWVNRLINLMEGLPQQGGREALAAIRNRGQGWLRLAEAVGKPAVTVPPAPRPAPRPPVASRPDRLSVTGITRLIRDPYAVYARSVLRLYPLNPLRQGPEARLRGSILHEVLERYVRVRDETPPEAARDRLLSIAGGVLAEAAPWAAARALWLARLDRAADFFLEQDRSTGGAPVALEEEGRIALDHGRFTLTAKPDRIDMLPDGRLHILDYKTGTPPTDKQQKHFDKQLVLEAAMAERGAFAALGPREVARITYVGLGSKPEAKGQTIDAADLATIWQELHRLIDRYLSPEQGFVSRRAPLHEEEAGDYDHLARHGEWDQTSAPIPEDLS
jgi:double-strand break repair protein AddB